MIKAYGYILYRIRLTYDFENCITRLSEVRNGAQLFINSNSQLIMMSQVGASPLGSSRSRLIKSAFATILTN